jgi:hypothetical protein
MGPEWLVPTLRFRMMTHARRYAKLAAPRLLDPRLEEVGQRHEGLVFAHAVEGRGIAKGAAQDILLDALALESSDGLELLMVFRRDIDRESGHAKTVVDRAPHYNIC